jgi:hypothetical protein
MSGSMKGVIRDHGPKEGSPGIWQTCCVLVQTCRVVMQHFHEILRSPSPSETTSDGISAVSQKSPEKCLEYSFAAHCLLHMYIVYKRCPGSSFDLARSSAIDCPELSLLSARFAPSFVTSHGIGQLPVSSGLDLFSDSEG